MAGGAETPNIAALPAIARLGADRKATVQFPRLPAQILVSNCCSRAMSIRLSSVIIRNWARLSRRSKLLRALLLLRVVMSKQLLRLFDRLFGIDQRATDSRPCASSAFLRVGIAIARNCFCDARASNVIGIA